MAHAIRQIGLTLAAVYRPVWFGSLPAIFYQPYTSMTIQIKHTDRSLNEARDRLDSWLQCARDYLDALSLAKFIIFAVLTALTFSFFFFCPRLWVMTRPLPGSFEWTRGLTYLQQCEAPFDQQVEAAMRWRILPALVSHGLGLTDIRAFVVPFAGLLALLGYWAQVSARLLQDRLGALLTTIVLATTGGTLTVTGWLGINDAWFVIGLAAVSAGRGWLSLVLAGLLAPWVDERFLLAWPLALFCRWWLMGRPTSFTGDLVVASLSLFPYILTRALHGLWHPDRESTAFVARVIADVPTWLPYGPLGWWMGLRGAWLLVLVGVLEWWAVRDRKTLVIGIGCWLACWLAVTLLAADLSRSTSVFTPLLLCGAVALQRLVADRARSTRWLAVCAVINLLTPYMMVTYNKVALTSPLPLELIRLYKNLP